jgi:hypothetical protein
MPVMPQNAAGWRIEPPVHGQGIPRIRHGAEA